VKRIVSLWLPRFRTDRLTRITTAAGRAPYQPWEDKPFAIAAEIHGGQRVAAVNAAAEAAGVSVGLPLADARALTPGLKTVTEDLKADQAALSRLTKGRTTIVVAHRLSSITDADCIFVLEAGRLVEQGSHDELIAAGGYYTQLYKAQKQTDPAG